MSRLLVAILDALGQARTYSYAGFDLPWTAMYGGDGGVTTPVTYGYDDDGRLTQTNNLNTGSPSAPGQNNVYYQYSADGAVSQVQNSSLNATTAYWYYPDGVLSRVCSIIPNLVNQPALYQYSYRNDGELLHEAFGVSNQAVTWSYTGGGRVTEMTDFGGSPSLIMQYGDGHGQLSSYTTPAGTYNITRRDSQGRLLQYSDPYAAINGETVTSQYNIRGDLVGRTFQPNPQSFDTGYPSEPGFQYRNVQGVLVQNAGDQYDGRTGAPLIVDFEQIVYDAIGRVAAGGGSSYSYDAESRLVGGDTQGLATVGDIGCSMGGTATTGGSFKELRYLYDAQGQLFQDVNQVGTRLNGGVQQHTRQWFWNGQTPLYTAQTSSPGSFSRVDGYQADGLGNITADGSSPGLTISDRDLDGAIAQRHNITGHSVWVASNPYHQECVSANPIPGSANYVDPLGPAQTTSVPPVDGTSDASLSVSSSGRGFLSTANGFMTPDYGSATPYSGGHSRGLLRQTRHY